MSLECDVQSWHPSASGGTITQAKRNLRQFFYILGQLTRSPTKFRHADNHRRHVQEWRLHAQLSLRNLLAMVFKRWSMSNSFQPPRFSTSRNLDKPLVGSDCLPVLAKCENRDNTAPTGVPQVDGDKIHRNIPKIGNRVRERTGD